MARTRRYTVGLAALVLSASAVGCSVGGSDSASTTGSTAVTTATTATTAASTTTTEAPEATTAAPATTAEVTTTEAPATTTPPTPKTTAEEVAVAFMRAAYTGGDPSPYVRDPSVADAARADWEVQGVPAAQVEFNDEYVDPNAQGGGPGECQLVGDVTVSCAVMVTYNTTGPGSSSTLYAVFVSNIDPDTDPSDPTWVDHYVVGFEAVAG